MDPQDVTYLMLLIPSEIATSSDDFKNHYRKKFIFLANFEPDYLSAGLGVYE
jgi:hypothetical protein